MNLFDLEITEVRTFNEFFTRKLKQGSRKWEKGICSPVDGKMMSYGAIQNGMIFQVKGMDYQVEELTGTSAFQNGSFINLYLSPADYHRVHAPFDMKLESIRHIPGRLLSVSKRNAKKVSNLYNKNERIVISGQSEFGLFHFVFVGALNVGSIKLSFLPKIKSNQKKMTEKKYAVNNNIKKGEELGWFEMGSTVIILLDSTDFSKTKSHFNKRALFLGERLTD